MSLLSLLINIWLILIKTMDLQIEGNLIELWTEKRKALKDMGSKLNSSPDAVWKRLTSLRTHVRFWKQPPSGIVALPRRPPVSGYWTSWTSYNRTLRN